MLQMNGIQAKAEGTQKCDGDITLSDVTCRISNAKARLRCGTEERNVGEWVDHAAMAMRKSKYEAFRDDVGGNLYGDIELELGKKIWNGWKLRQRHFEEIGKWIPWRILRKRGGDEQSFSYVPDQPAGRITLDDKGW